MTGKMEKYKVSIITPFPIVGAGLKSTVEKEEFSLDMMINDYTQAMQLVKKSNSDIIVADISPRFWVNTKLIKYIRNQKPSLPLLVCSGCNEYDHVKSCMEAGANGYVFMTVPEKKIVEAIRTVLGGGEYVNDGILRIDSAREKLVGSLNLRESKVFNLMGQGSNKKEIVNSLHIKVGTVSTYFQNIRRILGFNEMDELDEYTVQYSLQHVKSKDKPTVKLDKQVDSLLPRQSDVFDLIGQGAGRKKIATLLNIKYGTLRSHYDSIKNRLGFNSAHELRKYAIQHTHQQDRMQR